MQNRSQSFSRVAALGFGNVKIIQTSPVPREKQDCTQGKLHKTESGDAFFVEKIMTIIY